MGGAKPKDVWLGWSNKNRSLSKMNPETQLTPRPEPLAPDVLSSLILNGDLSKLTPHHKVEYYTQFCLRIGLDPATKPFELITLNGKQVMYATRQCAAQLNKRDGVSHTILSRETVNDCYLVIAKASTADRQEESMGAVSIIGLKGEALCNAMMKAETKAKRRSTLDLCGLGMMDETEAESASSEAPLSPLKPEEIQAMRDELSDRLENLGNIKDDEMRRQERVYCIELEKRLARIDPKTIDSLVDLNTNCESVIAMTEYAVKEIAKDHATTQESSKVSTPTPGPTALDWREVICHVGSAGGRMHLRKLGELVPAQINWLVNEWGPTRFTTDAKDNALYAAAVEALEANPYTAKPKTAPATSEAAQPPAGAQGEPIHHTGGYWDTIIPLEHDSVRGKKLGELGSEKATIDEWLRKIALALMPGFEANPMPAASDEMFVKDFYAACRERAIDTGEAVTTTTPYWSHAELVKHIVSDFDDLILTVDVGQELLIKLGRLKAPLASTQHPDLLALWRDWPAALHKMKEALKSTHNPKAARKKGAK